MNLGFGSIAALFRPTGPTQAQVNQQIALGGGNEVVRDKMVRDERRSRAMHLTGKERAKKVMLDKAGVTKPAGAKRG